MSDSEAGRPADLVRQVASVLLVAAIIGVLGAVALTGGSIVPDSPSPRPEEAARVLGATTTPDRGTVPEVVGLPQVYAMEVLRKAGFTGVVSVSRPDERVGKGKIANQIPAAGSALPDGGEVQLALSLGPDDRPVPNVVGYPINGALTLLERAGFGFVAEVEASEQPTGTVLRSQPSAGEKRPKGTTVALVLSGGPTPAWDAALLASSSPASGPGSWLQDTGEQATAAPGGSGTRPSVTLPTPNRPSATTRPPVTQPPATRPPTTRPPTPTPTTRPPTTQPSGPQCVTYPARTYWDEVELRWVRVPMSTVCI